MQYNETIWPYSQAQRLLELALKEDLGYPCCDATVDLLFSDTQHQNTALNSATLISKHAEPIILCGTPLIADVFKMLDSTFEIQLLYQDGDIVQPGAHIAYIKSDVHALFMAERIMLNFLGHLSAISTLTARFVERIRHTHLKILDTRKTTPGFRHLEKYAVACGGGVNHRMGLYDAIMVKDTHVDLLGGMKTALSKLPLLHLHTRPVIVEVRDAHELDTVLDLGREKVSRLLLDNIPVTQLNAYVAKCKGIFPTEVSGNVNLETIRHVAESGADFASIGMLTHSASNVDLSMRTLYKRS